MKRFTYILTTIPIEQLQAAKTPLFVISAKSGVLCLKISPKGNWDVNIVCLTRRKNSDKIPLALKNQKLFSQLFQKMWIFKSVFKKTMLQKVPKKGRFSTECIEIVEKRY